ncbi:MAG: hypothetical protein ACOC5A_06135 [Halanaerobiales bacterium]
MTTGGAEEKGEYPKEIDDDGLDNILENMWRAWEEKLQPIAEEIEKRKE